jgi:hypothetical protein
MITERQTKRGKEEIADIRRSKKYETEISIPKRRQEAKNNE